MLIKRIAAFAAGLAALGATVALPAGAQGCTYSLSPTSATVPAAGATGTFNVVTTPGCSWSATTESQGGIGWLSAMFPSSGSGNGTVTYQAHASVGPPRTARILVGGQAFTVNQPALSTSPAIVLLNGDFEHNQGSWTSSSSGGYQILNYEPGAHSGTYDAWFGGYHLAVDTLYQDITIPAAATTAMLRFWYQVGTEEGTTTPRDFLDVSLLNPVDNSHLAILAVLSNMNAGGWVQSAAVDLAAFRGQTVRLRFQGTTDAQLLTSFRVDDVTLAVSTGGEGTPRMANISTRAQVQTGADVMIGGFVIGGSAPKTVVIRARGPSLSSAGVPGVLANPFLQLFKGSTQLAVNEDYVFAPNIALLRTSGFAPSSTTEAAILTTLDPGAYTAIVSGTGGTTGVALVEVFEVDAPTMPLINIATRGRVLTGDRVMIAGFIIQGDGPQTVVVRARGPSLTAAGVPGALANPNLQLFTGSTQIGANDDWQQASNSAALQSSGFAPSDSRESAILTTLAPGAYTAIVSGVADTTGVAIVEVFAVP